MSEQTQQIEGVPVGTKIARIGNPGIGEWIIEPSSGAVRQVSSRYYKEFYVPILIPDNVYCVFDLATVPTPMSDQYERTGEFRMARPIDCFIGRNGFLCMNEADWRADVWKGDSGDTRRIILRRKKTVKRYLVMDRIRITPDNCVTPPGAISEGNATALMANVGGIMLSNLGGSLRIEEVEE